MRVCGVVGMCTDDRFKFNSDRSDWMRIRWEWDSGISNDRSDSSWIRASNVSCDRKDKV
jgi:uncharacterized protein involved in type VI secretion and phage assembly